MNGVLEVEMLDQLGQIIGISVHVVALPRLARPAMAATIVCDTPIPMRAQKEHLVFEGISAEWPAMAENDRLSGSPVFVVNLGSVFGSEKHKGGAGSQF